VVYKGASVSAKEILIALLSNGEFTQDMKGVNFSEVGAACACNPTDQLICALVFGKNMSTRQGEIMNPMGYVVDRGEC